MGPSPFTDKQMAKAMLEAVFPLRVSDDIQEGSPESQLNVEEKKDYLDRFFIAVCILPKSCYDGRGLKGTDYRPHLPLLTPRDAHYS